MSISYPLKTGFVLETVVHPNSITIHFPIFTKNENALIR